MRVEGELGNREFTRMDANGNVEISSLDAFQSGAVGDRRPTLHAAIGVMGAFGSCKWWRVRLECALFK